MTWEPIENLERAKDAIKDFHKKHPKKPKAKEIKRIEIPITQFPIHLLQPMPRPLTEPISKNQPTEAMVIKFARNGVRALRGG